MLESNRSWDTESRQLFGDISQRQIRRLEQQANDRKERGRTLNDVSVSQTNRWHRQSRLKAEVLANSLHDITERQYALLSSDPSGWIKDYVSYAQDAVQRLTLTLDALRQRGNLSDEQEEVGLAPVLGFDHELVVDGSTLERPVNYSLLRILPPAHQPSREDRAPILIVDPRAGHGAGIGGFKPESQVGEGLADGHPVYFAAFEPMPVAGQKLSDVRDAEVQFLATICQAHSNSPKPILIGNCQGGWASMLVAASAPELAGPVIINGAPMSYWAGNLGANPMRYLGGLSGGALSALMLADMGDGLFDGALLVSNFENLNPSNSLFGKYYHLYANADTEVKRFLEFERWWGGFYLMTEDEIRWIVENLFIGNKLARGEAVLGGERIDLRRIESPVIVFASHGDNITPPQQALNWIIETYGSLEVLKAMGKRIVYMLHESVGHLGIFVSAKVAGREHHAITETFRAIDALSPGLYEMKIEQGETRDHIKFEYRTFEDILALSDSRDKEDVFEAVAKLSALNVQTYERTLRPVVKSAASTVGAQMMRKNQPQRLSRRALSDRNPLMRPVKEMAQRVRDQRAPVDTNNPFLAMEKAGAQWMETSLDLYRDYRDSMMESLFFFTYTSPFIATLTRGQSETAERPKPVDALKLPEVKAALSTITEGGLAAGAVRMILLINRARGYVRRSRLERAFELLQTAEPFKSMSNTQIKDLVRQQTLIVDFERTLSLETLPQVLATADERRAALDMVMLVAGPRESMSPLALVQYMQYETLLAENPGQESPEQAAALGGAAKSRRTAKPADGSQSA